MKKEKILGILSILVLSLFAAGSVFAGDDDLPEPLKREPQVHQNGN